MPATNLAPCRNRLLETWPRPASPGTAPSSPRTGCHIGKSGASPPGHRPLRAPRARRRPNDLTPRTTRHAPTLHILFLTHLIASLSPVGLRFVVHQDCLLCSACFACLPVSLVQPHLPILPRPVALRSHSTRSPQPPHVCWLAPLCTSRIAYSLRTMPSNALAHRAYMQSTRTGRPMCALQLP